MSDRQSSLDQTLTSVISLLENEQTLKKVRVSCLSHNTEGSEKEEKKERSKNQRPGTERKDELMIDNQRST
jgi:hypothetical protein